MHSRQSGTLDADDIARGIVPITTSHPFHPGTVCLSQRRTTWGKTRQKNVLSMTGPFIANEAVCKCPACSRTFISDALLKFVQGRCNVAYDVLVFVWQALFQRHRTIVEVRIELLVHNVRISASEIGHQCRKLIMYLEAIVKRPHGFARPRSVAVTGSTTTSQQRQRPVFAKE